MVARDCFICGARYRVEWDHMPPQRLGGTKDVYPLCITCHGETDQHVPWDNWCPSRAIGGLLGLWGKADVNERRVLWKLFRSFCWAAHSARGGA